MNCGILGDRRLSGGGIIGTTFDPANIGPNITLSNGSLTATSTATVWATVTCIVADMASTGKYYWEFSYDTVDVGLGAIQGGMSLSDQDVNSFLGDANGKSWAYYNIATGLFYAGAEVRDIGVDAHTDGDVVMFALDQDNDKLWVGVNGVWFTTETGLGVPSTGANPSLTGTESASFGASGPAVSLYDDTLSVTANFGSSPFAYSVPSGFTAGWPKA